MALLSQSDAEARLGRALTGSETSAFTVMNAALQAHVERLIGSSLEQAGVTTRYYDGGVQHLRVDPCTDVASVKLVDDDLSAVYTYDTSDYAVEPLNRTLKTWLRHRSGPFVTGLNNIAVEAKFSIFGDTNTLNTVKNALLEALVAELENNDNVKRESIEGYSVEYASTEAKDALATIRFLFPEI